jgi:hypothetical protein
MANIFQKMGSAFGQYGMDNRMPADQFLNLPKGDRRQMQVEGLRKFSEAMNLIGAQQSGNPQRMALAQNQIRQRRVDRQNQELGDSAYEAVIQAGGTKEQAELARRNPNLASQIVAGSFNKNPPSSSEIINQKKLATLDLIRDLPGTLKERIRTLETKYPAHYGIYKNYIEKQDTTGILDLLLGDNDSGTSSSRFQVDGYPVD